MSLSNFEQDRSSTCQNSNEPSLPKTMGGAATVATPEEFVTKFGGKRIINKILIANNGISGT